MAYKNMPKNSLLIIIALKTRHRSIGTMLTMSKSIQTSENQLKVELHDF